MEEYLTVRELSSKMKFSQQTIYNLIHQKVFVLGKHYFKPRPKKILFKWSEIKAWIEGSSSLNDETAPRASAESNALAKDSPDYSGHNTRKSLINI